MPLNPKHLLFPLVFHPHSPPRPLPQPRLQPPGRHHRCSINLFTCSPVQPGQVTHPPPKRGVPHAAFAAAAASPSPPSHVHGGVPGPTMSCCAIRRTCASAWGAFWVGWVLGGGGGGGRAGGLGFSAGGGGLCWGGAAGARGVQPTTGQQDLLVRRVLPPQLTRLAQHGVFAAQVSVGRRYRSHSRNPDRIEHPRCGLRSSSWYKADRAMLNSAVPSR